MFALASFFWQKQVIIINIESRDNDEDCMNGAVADTVQFKIAEFTSISAKHNLTFVPEMLFQLTG